MFYDVKGILLFGNESLKTEGASNETSKHFLAAGLIVLFPLALENCEHVISVDTLGPS